LTESLNSIQKQIGYSFNDVGLLKQALTHRSAGKLNNERLEFLGDGILNFVIAEEIFNRYPDSPEGDLSRLRAHLVKGDTLSKLSAKLGLGDNLILGPGELKSGGFRRSSILADALEAIFGAVYIDGGFSSCKQLILALYKELLSSLADLSELKDPKTRLQELLQAKQLPLPEYNVIDITGKSHKQTFKVSCVVPSAECEVIGTGSSRRKAEQDAATQLLEQLSNE
jgi:ribonuclease-3